MKFFNDVYFNGVKIIFKCIYWIMSKVSYRLAFFTRYLFLRMFALDSKDNLEYYDVSENAFISVTEKNMIEIDKKDKIKRVMILGAFYHSNSFSLNLVLKSEFLQDKYQIEMCEEILDDNNCKKIIEDFGFSYRQFHVKRYSHIFDKIFKDTFDYIELSNYINENIDFLIMANDHTQRFTANKFLSLLKCKSIILTFGNLFLAHPKAKLQSKIQLPKSYSVKNNKLISYKSSYSFSNYTFFSDLYFYDSRDIVLDFKIKKRKNNILFTHGRLSLVGQIDFLKTVCAILKADDRRLFYFMGLDDTGISLNTIMHFFKTELLDKRVRYLGYFTFFKGDGIFIVDKNWLKCKTFLRKSSVYLNTFPMGMGSARIEAFASGIPVIDLEDSRHQYAKLEPVSKKHGTAVSIPKYINLVDKIMSDEEYSNETIKEQYKIVEKFCSAETFWKKIDQIIVSESK